MIILTVSVPANSKPGRFCFAEVAHLKDAAACVRKVPAAGLANRPGNRVTLSYRREDFVRLKEKNGKRIQEYLASGKVRAIFNSGVTEIKPDTMVIQEGKVLHNLHNDFVFVFAGGELPTELLKRRGVELRPADVDVKAAQGSGMSTPAPRAASRAPVRTWVPRVSSVRPSSVAGFPRARLHWQERHGCMYHRG